LLKTLAVRYCWEDETSRKGNGYLPSYDEAMGIRFLFTYMAASGAVEKDIAKPDKSLLCF